MSSEQVVGSSDPLSPPSLSHSSASTANGTGTPPEPGSPTVRKAQLGKGRTWSRDIASPALNADLAISAPEFTQMLIDEQTLPALPDAMLEEPDADEISDKLSERKGEMPESKDLVNRELSWIEFNKRVLSMAEREDMPLLERVGRPS